MHFYRFVHKVRITSCISAEWKTLPVPIGERHWQGLGSVSDHRTHHTPPRTTWKQRGQREIKIKWNWAEAVKTCPKQSKKVLWAGSGPWGRGFKSRHSDQKSAVFAWKRRIFCLFCCEKCAQNFDFSFWPHKYHRRFSGRTTGGLPRFPYLTSARISS